MPTAVVCPNCRARFEVASDIAADEAIRCAKCVHTFLRGDSLSAGIQTAPAPILVKPVQEEDRRDEPPDENRRPRRPAARPPIAMTSFLWVAVGVLLLLLFVSIGFNLWVLVWAPDRRFRFEDQIRAQEEAARARAMAEQARQMAQQAEMAARMNLEELKKKQDDLAEQLKLTEEQLEKARRDLKKNPDDEAALQLRWGTLEGRVVWKGDPPEVKSLETAMRNHVDGPAILKGPKELRLDPTYRIDPKSQGVANVAVFFKLTDKARLPIHPEDRTRKGSIAIDAPFCVYQPHMVALYPEWFDGVKRGDTGQTFFIKNTSPVAQNARTMGVGQANQPFNRSLNRVTDFEVRLKPEPLPLAIVCDIHPWMKAYAWVFDHPYHAITGEDGTFKMPRVPAGATVQVMAWHESRGWLFTKNGRTLKLADGKNTLDFEMGPLEQ